ncbi:MAG: hypothetical protein ACK4KX_03275 [Parvibaculum sp.]|uniref:hypothetical protein n=1 Tax=Parvibaculum sp. TaxID=2024848 RepID=UPI00391B01E3
MNPLAWINTVSSLAGEGSPLPGPPGSQLSMPSMSSATGHAEVNNQFNTGAFALRGDARSDQAGSGLLPLAIGGAALIVVFFIARKVL